MESTLVGPLVACLEHNFSVNYRRRLFPKRAY